MTHCFDCHAVKPRYRWRPKYNAWLLALPWAAAREFRVPGPKGIGVVIPMWLRGVTR